jgi:hypothetical protein
MVQAAILLNRPKKGLSTIMKHAGILAHNVKGAALCLRAFCQKGFRERSGRWSAIDAIMEEWADQNDPPTRAYQ